MILEKSMLFGIKSKIIEESAVAALKIIGETPRARPDRE
jgi:hypothetical protein